MDKVGERGNKRVRIKGRPTLQQRKTIQEDIHEYFRMGVSAAFCVDQTGYKKDTVYSYFKEWTEELIVKTDFITQQQETKVRLISALDKIIKNYDDQASFLLSKRTNKYNAALENSIAKVLHFAYKLQVDKANVLMTPTLDITIPKALKEKWGINIEELAATQNALVSENH